MFTSGQRVRLVSDFNNEPGIIEKGTRGTVVNVDTENCVNTLVFVTFDNVSKLQDRVRINNAVAGLPMYESEIEVI